MLTSLSVNGWAQSRSESNPFLAPEALQQTGAAAAKRRSAPKKRARTTTRRAGRLSQDATVDITLVRLSSRFASCPFVPQTFEQRPDMKCVTRPGLTKMVVFRRSWGDVRLCKYCKIYDYYISATFTFRSFCSILLAVTCLLCMLNTIHNFSAFHYSGRSLLLRFNVNPRLCR